jgi:hypothetical protein
VANIPQQPSAKDKSRFDWKSWLHSVGVALVVIVALLAMPSAQEPAFMQSDERAQPTPTEGMQAIKDEVIVVVAQLNGAGSGDDVQQINLAEIVQQAAAQVGRVTVVPIGYPLAGREQAQAVGAAYNATLVIYGRVAKEGVTASYEFTYAKDGVIYANIPDIGMVSPEVEHFDALLSNDMDTRVILDFTIG